ncbi:MAG: hypothetical protein ACLPKT_08640 [Methylocella sp.]
MWKLESERQLKPDWRRQGYHCLNGYRWGRLALFGEMNRQAPSHWDPEELDLIIEQAWKDRKWAE